MGWKEYVCAQINRSRRKWKVRTEMVNKVNTGIQYLLAGNGALVGIDGETRLRVTGARKTRTACGTPQREE